jgi:hypothetical protein
MEIKYKCLPTTTKNELLHFLYIQVDLSREVVGVEGGREGGRGRERERVCV